ncbi:nitroreductase family deazaflavin-dependent oxidoreductase [Nocardioides ferulae]|uniref:nitroreductase family deazaflavin-dependent oxidoreductase n=1 Tax=Nocardioides ferulae TaxID=2340821 RepID=UPI000EACE4B4|nr:nitroreductase family deazaflavin-dependent oxidoreductase [Nocardioides ferulae]
MDIQEMNRKVIEQFRAGEEFTVQGMTRDQLLLLTTVGRQSGEPRTSPMMFHRSGGRIFVIASAGGASKHPAWFHNLDASPSVRVEVGEEDFTAEGRVLTGADRAAIWSELLATYPFFAQHERRAAPREIPVVELVR